MKKTQTKVSKEELKEQAKILQQNIKQERDMVKKNKSYTNSKGQTFTPSHYKKASSYDKEELRRTIKKLRSK